jgi:hypothetical protein
MQWIVHFLEGFRGLIETIEANSLLSLKLQKNLPIEDLPYILS